MFSNLTGWHLLVIVALVVLLFGAAQRPALAKSGGQSMRIFKGEMNSLEEENSARSASEVQAPSATEHVTPSER